MCLELHLLTVVLFSRPKSVTVSGEVCTLLNLLTVQEVDPAQSYFSAGSASHTINMFNRVLRSDLIFADLVKQDPGRARQSS